MEKDAFRQSANENWGGAATLDKSILVIDGDRSFCDRLARALSSRGFTPRTRLKAKRADARGVILTAHAAVATAVAALESAGDVVVALMAGRLDMPAELEPTISPNRVRWEQHNLSEAARRFNVHRRTLQRIFAQGAPSSTGVKIK